MWMGIYPEDVRLNAVQAFPDFDPTEYVTQQKKWYTSNDPAHSYVNDDASLWNMFYKPLFDYIDTLPDYYAMGFDAWIYVIDDGNQNIICDAVFLNVKLAKVDDAGNLVEGAVFYVEDEDGNEIVDGWESDGENYLTINNLDIGKEYTIEESAPAGYIPVSEDIKFSISLENGITLLSGQDDAEVLTGGVIKIKNDRTFVTIVKTDSEGNPVPGAKFELRDGNNKNASEGRFDDLTKSSYTLYNLSYGPDYTLIELEAPDGYISITSKISFYIDENNRVILNDEYEGVTLDASTNTISIANKETSVSISKREIGKSDELKGATLEIYNASDIDDEGNVINDAAPVETWVSGSDVDENGDITCHVIKAKLAADNDYIIRETIAPEGYSKLKSDIRFSVSESGEVTSEDAKLEDGIIIVYNELEEVTETKEEENKEEVTTETTTQEETTETTTEKETTEITTEKETTETVTTEELTTEEVTVVTSTTDTDTDVAKSKSTSTETQTGDNSKPINIALLMLLSLDTIFGMIVYKLIKR